MVHHPGGRPMTGLCTVEGDIGSWSSLVASRAARDDERPAMFHVEISSRCAGTKVRLQRLDSTGLYCAVLYCAVLFPAVSECATDRPAPGRPAPHSLLARRVPDGDEDGDGEGNGCRLLERNGMFGFGFCFCFCFGFGFCFCFCFCASSISARVVAQATGLRAALPRVAGRWKKPRFSIFQQRLCRLVSPRM